MGDAYTSYRDEELLEMWEVERDLTKRDELVSELQRRGLFPRLQKTLNAWEEEGGLYPSTEDPYFIEKLMEKQEFAENLQESIAEQKARGENPCDPEREFELTPVQRFVSRFLSPQCPYLSALLYHGVGVGKTCAAITIAEAHLQANPSDQVYIVAPRNIHSGFRRTIYDDEALRIGTEEGQPNTAKGCTGNSYLLRTGSEFEREKSVINRRVTQTINSRYRILGYIQFYRVIQEILDKVPKGLNEERRRQEETKLLRREFSGKLLIIDEAHNLRDTPGETEDDDADAAGGDIELSESKAGKRLTPALIRVLGAADGLKLVLLTGTPMYNNYREIIFLCNLLLMNDKKATISEKDIFLPTGKFRPGGEERLGAIASAYISFMRGENPLSFPVRLPPKGTPLLTVWPALSPEGQELSKESRDLMLRLPFVPVSFEGATVEQIRAYADSRVETGGLGVRSLDEMVQSGNWFFPAEDPTADPSTRIRDAGFDSVFEELKGASVSQFRSIGDAGWLARDRIHTASPKTALLLRRIRTARGVVFCYSRFIKSGALPLAIALEANGYIPWGRDVPLFSTGVVDGLGRQCAKCDQRERGHKGHTFVPAKYVLLTGQAAYSPNNPAAIQAARSVQNQDGQQVKVVIGSQVASEGIDLRFIREIYVFDSWFHMNKMEQVLGRGVRTCSHSMLPQALRNCTIHMLLHTFPDGETETADMYMYRIAMAKALQVGRITRVLKRYALDCNLNHSAIFIRDLPPLDTMEDSQGQTRENVELNDTPYTSICDWMECAYTCAKPVDIQRKMKDGELNFSTYDEYAMRWRETQLKQILKAVFEVEDQAMVEIGSLTETMRQADIPEVAIRALLSEIVNQPSFRLRVGGQEGYIIYRNGYYLFQPIRLTDVRIPLALRIADVPVRKDVYEPGRIVYSTTTLVPAGTGTTVAADAEGATVPAAAEVAVPALPTGVSRTDSSARSYWIAVLAWAEQLKDGTADLDIPDAVLTAIEGRITGDEYKREYNILVMISWMYEYIQRSPDVSEDKRAPFRKALAECLVELVWDESFSGREQRGLLDVPPGATETYTQWLDIAAKEQRIRRGTTTAFRFVNPSSGAVEYLCGDGACSEAVVRLFESDASDPLKSIQANRNTTGPIYGFIIPKLKDRRLVFKTNDRPVDPGVQPEKGGECEIVSSIEIHKKQLREIRTMLVGLGYPEFLLSDVVLDEKGARKKDVEGVAVGAVAAKPTKKKQKDMATGVENAARAAVLKLRSKLALDSRKFQNVVKACALKNIILRLLDKLETARIGKRYFYRPVAALKARHKLK